MAYTPHPLCFFKVLVFSHFYFIHATYSKGLLQRLSIAQTLLADPQFLILDEPTNGLDPYSQWQVRQIIASLRIEQARGNLEIARYYEKRNHTEAARIYYNEVVNLSLGEPNSPHAQTARKRLTEINAQLRNETGTK